MRRCSNLTLRFVLEKLGMHCLAAARQCMPSFSNYERCLTIVHALGDQCNLGYALQNLGNIYL